MTSELFYAHILNMSRVSLHSRSFSRIHPSVFKYQLTKHAFAGPKSCRGFRETGPCSEKPGPGARFSKAPETFRACKAIFSSSVSKNGEVYTPETSCMKGTSAHVKNMWIKQLCNRTVRNFAMAFRARKVSGAFEKRAPDYTKLRYLVRG